MVIPNLLAIRGTKWVTRRGISSLRSRSGGTSIGNTFLGNPLVISGELDGTVFQSSSWDGENAAVVAHQNERAGVTGEHLLQHLQA